MARESRPETPEETLARLAAYSTPTTAPAGSQSPYGPATPETLQTPANVPPAAATLGEPGLPAYPGPRRSRRATVVTAVVTIGAVLVVVIALVAVFGIRSFFDGGATGADYGQWKDYPGSAFEKDSDVLAAPSKEDAVANADAFVAEYRAELTQEFGLGWTQTSDGSTGRGTNGYGGDSMLYDYSSGQWQGAATLDDPDARQKVKDIFQALTKKYDADDFLFANDLYKNDAKKSRTEYGGTTLATQAMWSLSDHGGIAPTFLLSSDVLDLSIPRDRAFQGDVWFDEDAAQGKTFLVTIRLDGYGLLSAADRDEYQKRLAAFDLDTKPEVK